ncbi:MAG: hypothetical protein GC157_14370 [Frankiales bacterium]|nr:hypothetical protein [Frankiales bacterium]
MGRRHEVHEYVEASQSAATILPGVPLPDWTGLGTTEPEPDPEPDPRPHPAPEPAAVLVGAGAVSVMEQQSAQFEAPTAPPTAYAAPPSPAPVAPVAPAPVGAPSAAAPAPLAWPAPGPAAPGVLDAPVPALAPLEGPAPVLAPVANPAPVAAATDQPVAVPAPPVAAPVLAAPPAAPSAAAEPAPVPQAADPGQTEDVVPGEAAGPDAGAPERSRRTLVLLVALGAVAVLAAVAAFVYPGLLTGSAEPAPVAPRSQPAQPAAPQAAPLAAPASVAGLARLTGAPATVLQTTAASTTLTGLGTPVSAVYGAKGVPGATVIAWPATVTAPAAVIDSAFAGFATASGHPVTDLAVVPTTGGLAGQMSCGTATVSAAPATVCFWADGTSFGAVTVLHPASAKDGALTAVAIRQGVENGS